MEHHNPGVTTMECCLSKGELIKLDGGKSGLVLRCTLGTVWLTCGDGTDYLLSAGRSFELAPLRNAVIEALETSGFYLGEPAVTGEIVRRPIMGFTACKEAVGLPSSIQIPLRDKTSTHHPAPLIFWYI